VAGALYLIGCGGSVTGGANVSAVVATSSETNGHSHQCTVPRSDIRNPVNATYRTTAAAGHDHMVVLSIADLTNLSLGGVVTVSSTTTANHRHDFRFRQS